MRAAIAFTYYEALIRANDVDKFGEEEVRLKSMRNLMNVAGFVEDIYEDFAEEAFELMRELARSMQAMNGAAPDILLRSFNDYDRPMSIITYFKVVRSRRDTQGPIG